jgi:hypothetical protein
MLTRLEVRRYRCLENIGVALPKEIAAHISKSLDVKPFDDACAFKNLRYELRLKIHQEKQIRVKNEYIYKKITSSVSVQGCKDKSFLELRGALKTWFPPTKETKEVLP